MSPRSPQFYNKPPETHSSRKSELKLEKEGDFSKFGKNEKLLRDTEDSKTYSIMKLPEIKGANSPPSKSALDRSIGSCLKPDTMSTVQKLSQQIRQMSLSQERKKPMCNFSNASEDNASQGQLRHSFNFIPRIIEKKYTMQQVDLVSDLKPQSKQHGSFKLDKLSHTQAKSNVSELGVVETKKFQSFKAKPTESLQKNHPSQMGSIQNQRSVQPKQTFNHILNNETINYYDDCFVGSVFKKSK